MIIFVLLYINISMYVRYNICTVYNICTLIDPSDSRIREYREYIEMWDEIMGAYVLFGVVASIIDKARSVVVIIYVIYSPMYHTIR